MSRPGPLQDLLLAHFVPSGACSSLKTPTVTKSAKRPISPSKSTIFSPAKRRILRSEGILLPGEGSPSSFCTQLPSSGSDAFGVSHASTSLMPPVSGAHRSSKDRRASRRPSPKLTRQCSVRDDSTPALNLRRSSRLQSSQSRTTPITIPREMPLPHDRQSVHYPGFDTYQDTHVFLVHPRQTSPSSDSEDLWSSSEDILSEGEISKENIPPWKKAKKSSLARSSVPMGKSSCSNQSTPREKVRRLSGISADGWRIDDVVTHSESSLTELPTAIIPE